jgi:hypothetical protein
MPHFHVPIEHGHPILLFLKRKIELNNHLIYVKEIIDGLFGLVIFLKLNYIQT